MLGVPDGWSLELQDDSDLVPMFGKCLIVMFTFLGIFLHLSMSLKNTVTVVNKESFQC